MQSYANPAACGSPTTITDSERFMIEEAMHTLSDREKDCYMMKYGQCFSERQIASMLDISQQAVNKNIQNAERKINESIKSNLFLQIS
ncbi:positive control sigma-like factor [compost metagenome]